jgi:outer membrane protein OmpA-like peptidoglycan-associated protein
MRRPNRRLTHPFSLSLFLTVALALVLGLLPTAGLYAQETEDFTGKTLTEQALIDALKPDAPAPAAFRTRGGTPLEPDCEFYWKNRTRGAGSSDVLKAIAVDILFETGSAELTSQARSSLDTIGQALVSAALAPCCFVVEGHTDSQGSDSLNQSLSNDRAKSVVEYLSSKYSVDSGRLMPVGKGESEPVADNETAAGRQRNRRVKVLNLGYGQVGG